MLCCSLVFTEMPLFSEMFSFLFWFSEMLCYTEDILHISIVIKDEGRDGRIVC